jgi:hypothetical protein
MDDTPRGIGAHNEARDIVDDQDAELDHDLIL